MPACRRDRPFNAGLLFAALLITTAFTLTACGEPPDKEIQQAQGAIDTARAAGADQYAHDEWTAAQDALKQAEQAVVDRDYRLALNRALDSRERAQNAAKEAADNKAMARADADRTITEATRALADARARIKAPASGRGGVRTVQNSLADSEAAVQKARAAYAAGDYRAVTEGLPPVIARLRGTGREGETAASTTGRRHK